MCNPKVTLKLKRQNQEKQHSILPHYNVCLETINTNQCVRQLVILSYLLAIIPHRAAQRPAEHY